MTKKASKEKASIRNMLNFISEAGMLKRVSRSGWSVLGIKNAESVADHSFRCAVIAYVLARMENVEPYKALLMALFNDIQEARITDLHKMAQRYIKDVEAVEDSAFYKQIGFLPENLKKELSAMRNEYTRQNTAESVIARDADILECLIQAKEYYQHGFLEAAKFMKGAPQFLKTKSAKNLWRLARKNDTSRWWLSLSEFKR
ncbi:MAG: HD domain-containing protein [Candidatus Omnitrophota bacterium]